MQTRTILIALRNADDRTILSAALAHHGYRVCAGQTAEDAYRCARAEQPDLVIAEYPLHTGEGPTLLAMIKGNPFTAATLVITVTVDPDASELRQAVLEGADGYLPYPFDTRRTVDLVQRFIGAPETPADTMG